MRKERPVTYPELILPGPSGLALSALCVGDDPPDINEMAYRVGQLATVLVGPEHNVRQVHSDSYLYWSIHRWIRSGHQTFSMGMDLAWGIAHTEPASSTFDLLPDIPADGMYVSVPPVFDIGDETNGWYRVEGFFLTVNDIRVRTDGTPSTSPLVSIGPSEASMYDVRRGITVVCVGEDKSPNLSERIERGEAWDRDDWLVFFNLVPGQPLPTGEGTSGASKAAQFVYNLIHLLQNTTELAEEADPDRPEFVGTDRKTRRERERQHRKGRSVHPHRVWHPSDLPVTPDPDAPVADTPVRKVSGHVVLGHIRRYWVRNPAGFKSLGTRSKGSQTYHLVARWVRPHVRGEGPDARPR